MKWTPKLLKMGLNIYGPYVGAGVKVTHIDDLWREIHVRMKLRWYNRNIMGTHFGGSLYSMIDPHLMILAMQRLGTEYIVWDRAAEITYLKPATGTVSTQISLDDEQLEDIVENTKDGSSYHPSFEIKIRDEQGKVVSKINKTLYVKRKVAA